VHPDDCPRLEQQREWALRGNARALASEFRVVLKDGAVRWLQIEGAFLPSIELRAAGVARDITRRKLADEQMQLVMTELKHRIRNLFAVVGSIFQQTLRSAAVPDHIGAAVSGRLSVLAGRRNCSRSVGVTAARISPNSSERSWLRWFPERSPAAQ
jgi:HWE histidine kinase/PAS fold